MDGSEDGRDVFGREMPPPKNPYITPVPLGTLPNALSSGPASPALDPRRDIDSSEPSVGDSGFLVQGGGHSSGRAPSSKGSVEESCEIEDAIQLADQLGEQLRGIRDREGRGKVLGSDVLDRLHSVEQAQERSIALREQLLQTIRRPAPLEQLGALHAILTTWTRRPNDLLVMMKLSEQATVLADIIATFREIRVALEGKAPPTSDFSSGERPQ